MKIMTYVGGYTDDKREGIHIFESDTETGSFRPLGKIGGIENATFFTINRACTRLYAGLGDPALGNGAKNGVVAAYAIEGTLLRFLNSQRVGGVTPPCYVELDTDETHLVFAEYVNAMSGLFKLNADGSLKDHSGVMVMHFGDGPNKPRQDKAHAHCSVVTPDGKYLLIVDLGLDEVKAYDYAACKEGEMREVKNVTIKSYPGGGPRHILFHPNGKLAFLIHELGNTMSSYRYDGSGFELIETQKLLPPEFTEKNTASAVKLTADGTQLFGTNRGHNSIAVFDIDPATGKMQLKRINKLVGRGPRDFSFMPGEKFALVGHENSNSIMTYAYDRATGIFTPQEPTFTVFRPVCVKFGAKC